MGLQNIDFSNLDSMELTINSNSQLTELINQKIKTYHIIDVSVAMTNLANVGKILKLAYAGSKGFSCSTNTLEILSKYQTMINNSFIASASFVESCLSALKYHEMAIFMAEKNKFDSSIRMIEKCSELANNMATKSGELVNEAKCLCELSEKALLTAQNDENVSNEEKERITQMIIESKTKTAELEEKTVMLYEQIEIVKKQQFEVAQKIDEEREREYDLQMISAVMAPLTKIVEIVIKPFAAAVEAIFNSNSNIKNADEDTTTNETVEENHASLLEEKERLILEMKNDLQNQERETNIELAYVGELLKTLKENEEDLSASIYSLELAIKALGKIKTTFEHTRRFWLGVESLCKGLANIGILKELNTMIESNEELRNKFIDELKNSGLSWLALGKINYNALLSIKEVDKQTDNILNNLPTKSEALLIVQNEADDILNSLQNEKSILDTQS